VVLAAPCEHDADMPIRDLTCREAELLALMATGRTNRAIGEALCLSERTVESHVRSIYSKLIDQPSDDLDRRVVAVRRYLDAQLDTQLAA
jgi:DNA-binding NarL/FixJ family response regulator